MQYRRLGRTGLRVTPLCFGGNVFGWTIDEDTSFAVLDAYHAGGGNFIDSADVYSRWIPGNQGGESEAILGRWMAARGNRAEIVLATKAGSEMSAAPNGKGLSRQHIMHAVEESLRRLQTEYIDLYQAHFDDAETPLEETLRAFDDLIRAGKVRYIGASNYSAWRLTSALWQSDKHSLASYVSHQPVYNLIKRDEFERELEPLCLDQGIGVIPYSTLASGFLTGKYRRDGVLPSSGRATGVKNRYMNESGFAILDAVDAVARDHNATPTQVALGWILARPSITAPIASATTIEQTNELLGALDVHLSADALATLDAASAWKSA